MWWSAECRHWASWAFSSTYNGNDRIWGSHFVSGLQCWWDWSLLLCCAHKHKTSTPGCKLNKERISALLCANADGSNRLTPVIVGNAKKPHAIKSIMNQLPVIYESSKNAWFTSSIFSDWFLNHFVPEVRRFQEETMKIPLHAVKAVLLLDNAPAHRNSEKLVSNDGKIKCVFLPPNTTSILQPMNQGVIVACKRRCV